VHTEVNHTSDIHEPALFYRLFRLCADKQNICAVAVEGMGLRMCRSDVTGSFLVTKFEFLSVLIFSIMYFPLHRNKDIICEAVKFFSI